MEPSIRELVRDWRLDIISEGMYLDPSIIMTALESGEGLEEAAKAVAEETRKEIADYSKFKTTGSLPVAEFLQVLQTDVMEGPGGIIAGTLAGIGGIALVDQINKRTQRSYDYDIIDEQKCTQIINLCKRKIVKYPVLRRCITQWYDRDRRVTPEAAPLIAIVTIKDDDTRREVLKDIARMKADLGPELDKMGVPSDMNIGLNFPLRVGSTAYELTLLRDTDGQVTESVMLEGKKSGIQKAANRYMGLMKYGMKHNKKMLTDPRYRRNQHQALKMAGANASAGAGNVIVTGKFEKSKEGLKKVLATCKTADDIKYIRADSRLGDKEFKRARDSIAKTGYLPDSYGKNKKPPYTLKELDDHIKWLKTEYPKMINQRSKEISSKMESSTPVEEGDVLRYLNPANGHLLKHELRNKFGKKNRPHFDRRPLTPQEISKATAIVKRHITKYPRLNKSTKFKSPKVYEESNGRVWYSIADVDIHIGYADVSDTAEDFTSFFKNVNEDIKKAGLQIEVGNEGDWDTYNISLESKYSKEVDVKENFDYLIESMFDSIYECGFNPNQRNMNEITPIDGGQTFSVTPWSNAEKTVGLALCDICEAETDDEITEAMLHFGRVAEAVIQEYSMEEVEESIGSTVRAGARKVRNTGRAISRKTDKAIKSASTTAKKVVDPMVTLVATNMEKFKKADAAERRELILKGGLIPKIMRWLKRSIGLAVGVAVGVEVPAVALITTITFIGMICSDQYLDRKERNNILRQLEDEMEIVNEKIDDARGDTSKKKKYELMRIRNKLKRTSDKIRYNLRTNPEDEVVQNIKAGKANVK